MQFNEEEDITNSEYFRSLIDSKLHNRDGSYFEQLAMKQMSGMLDPEGKLLHDSQLGYRGAAKRS